MTAITWTGTEVADWTDKQLEDGREFTKLALGFEAKTSVGLEINAFGLNLSRAIIEEQSRRSLDEAMG